MSDAVLKLLPMVEALTTDERHELSGHLDEMDDEALSTDVKSAWIEEAERRLERMRTGNDLGESGEEVMASMKEKYG